MASPESNPGIHNFREVLGKTGDIKGLTLDPRIFSKRALRTILESQILSEKPKVFLVEYGARDERDFTIDVPELAALKKLHGKQRAIRISPMIKSFVNASLVTVIDSDAIPKEFDYISQRDGPKWSLEVGPNQTVETLNPQKLSDEELKEFLASHFDDSRPKDIEIALAGDKTLGISHSMFAEMKNQANMTTERFTRMLFTSARESTKIVIRHLNRPIELFYNKHGRLEGVDMEISKLDHKKLQQILEYQIRQLREITATSANGQHFSISPTELHGLSDEQKKDKIGWIMNLIYEINAAKISFKDMPSQAQKAEEGSCE